MATAALGIRLTLVCPADGGLPVIELTLSATLLPEADAIKFYKPPHWHLFAELAEGPKTAKLSFGLPSPLFPLDAIAGSNVQQTNAADNQDFLQFENQSYANLGDSFGDMVKRANEGVKHADCHPQLCEEGEGGTYFLRDAEGKRIGVFKPADEDPQAENNPKKKLRGDGSNSPRVLRKTIPKGEAALREVAAYELDKGYAGVPPTCMMKAQTTFFNNANQTSTVKTGSLQLFVDAEKESWDVAPNRFSTTDIHRIAIFDIRSLNTDRHGGNMLAVPREEPKEGGIMYDLVPIDHGFCFPTALSEANWEWLYWPQAKKPFSKETLDFIASINIDEDSALLRRLGLSEEAVRVNRLTTMLLQRAAASGLTLFEIAKLCLRKKFRDQEETSPLEKACAVAEAAAADDPVAFWLHLEPVLNDLVKKH